LILRPHGESVLAIGQASHAWLSGQLARAWGNARFAPPDPYDEVCLGALQHDIGMADWDLRPARHRASGLPVQFFELDRPTHLALWSAAPRRVLSQSAYAALLVSLHGTGLYERFPPKTDDPEIARAVAEYRADQRALQAELAAAVGATPEEQRRNQALLAAWDGLSLALCQDRLPTTVALGAATLTLTPTPTPADIEGRLTVDSSPSVVPRCVVVDPWPFGPDELEVRAEGRLLDAAGYADEAALQNALDRAPVLTVRMVLRPRR
jgi:Protein of unknown function (DUF3891)